MLRSLSILCENKQNKNNALVMLHCNFHARKERYALYATLGVL